MLTSIFFPLIRNTRESFHCDIWWTSAWEKRKWQGIRLSISVYQYQYVVWEIEALAFITQQKLSMAHMKNIKHTDCVNKNTFGIQNGTPFYPNDEIGNMKSYGLTCIWKLIISIQL